MTCEVLIGDGETLIEKYIEGAVDVVIDEGYCRIVNNVGKTLFVVHRDSVIYISLV